MSVGAKTKAEKSTRVILFLFCVSFFPKTKRKKARKTFPRCQMATKKDTAYLPSNILLTGMQCM
jgi:hypothetical protein